MVVWNMMKHGMEVGLGHTVLDRETPSLPQMGTAPTFRPMSVGQMAGWIKMPLGTEVGLGPGDIALDGDPTPPEKGAH